MKKIVTIAREFGSGGRYIGKLAAEKLGYKFYDKELIMMMSKESGLSDEFIEEAGEKITNSMLFNVAMGGVYLNPGYNNTLMPLSDKLFVVQSNIIKRIAEEGPCIIVGRCADYILKERDDCLNVFIHCPDEQKAERATKIYNMPEKNIEKEIKRRNKARSSHYYYYTGLDWGSPGNYDIVLNSGSLGADMCADIIADIAKNC